MTRSVAFICLVIGVGARYPLEGAAPITVDTKYLLVSVDPTACRWSAQVPDGFSARRAELSGGLTATMKNDWNLLTVDYTPATGQDVEWKVFF